MLLRLIRLFRFACLQRAGDEIERLTKERDEKVKVELGTINGKQEAKVISHVEMFGYWEVTWHGRDPTTTLTLPVKAISNVDNSDWITRIDKNRQAQSVIHELYNKAEPHGFGGIREHDRFFQGNMDICTMACNGNFGEKCLGSKGGNVTCIRVQGNITPSPPSPGRPIVDTYFVINSICLALVHILGQLWCLQ